MEAGARPLRTSSDILRARVIAAAKQKGLAV